jgi:hypothetical protein
MHKAVLINKVGPNLGKFGWNPTGDWITPKMCCQKEASRKAQNGYGNTGIQTAGLFSMEREYLKIHDFSSSQENQLTKSPFGWPQTLPMRLLMELMAPNWEAMIDVGYDDATHSQISSLIFHGND